MKRLFISKTIRRIAYWNTAVMLGLYVFFLVFTLFTLNIVLIDDVDSRLSHEIEHISHSIAIIGDSLEIIFPGELQEPDLKYVTENPFFLQVYDLKGKILLQSENLMNHAPILAGFPNSFSPYYFESFFIKEEHLRTIYKPLINENKDHIGYMQLSAHHTSFNKIVKTILWFNVFALPLIIIVIGLISIFLAKKSYSPINKIIDLANSISATNINSRLTYEAESEDELGKLKNTLNSLFDRLETQISEISQFTDNASHQLMTPLTAIKTELDYILKRDFEISDYKETCNILKDQTDRMIAMVRTMLIMSRDCSDCTDGANVFQFSKLLENEISFINNQRLVFDIEKDIYLRGNSEYFSNVLQNLFNNALKYSPNEKEVSVSLISKKGMAIMRIADQGIGIDDNEKENVFKRFYRVERDDVQKKSGYGLGLSLVKSVTTSMGGKIKVFDNKPNGTIFELKLPLLKFS